MPCGVKFAYKDAANERYRYYGRKQNFFIFGVLNFDKNNFDVGTFQQFDTVHDAVVFAVNNSFYAALNNEFGTFDAWRLGNVERGTIAAVVAARHFGNGVRLSVQNVGFRYVVVVFANVFKTR